ncbi:AAA family ATPase [Janthinobacterium sp. SUN100]|uniref:ATP-dependent nuclease n=1 Tax=Janthinobacterium sp. SUN100 TaxID=3004101 RepID=UPI0025B1483D|nr:AAA family ATPase [Janthinobacterium sp. SUN100]MDN2702528.1 AAA family ATPase [Janthinobacterium sp. SUN100]
MDDELATILRKNVRQNTERVIVKNLIYLFEKMKIRKISLENVRSFLELTEFHIDGEISIIVGPNGGGKTNLLDTIITVIRRFIMPPWSARSPGGTEIRLQFSQNQNLHMMTLEKHERAENDAKQSIVVIVEVTQQDIDNIKAIKDGVDELNATMKNRYLNGLTDQIRDWDIDGLKEKSLITYTIVNGAFQDDFVGVEKTFVQYLRNFEWIAQVREDGGLLPLSTPLLYLPVNRAASGFQSSVSLAGFNYFDHKQNSDLATSRVGGNVLTLAIGRIAQKFRLLLEEQSGTTDADFYGQPQMQALSEMLKLLGYTWRLDCVNALRNEYDIRLTKQGASFSVNAASSGEKELLNYLFCIYALNVRDALIVVDEPELHLHPRWQRVLLSLFEQLSSSTGNQFVLATHSSVFISPASIQYVSRVFSENQQSKIVKINDADLPDARHLFGIVNSHNNESIFFADKVILVEGLSDKLLFEALLKKIQNSETSSIICEIISVGGKGFFSSYSTLLDSCKVPYALIADLDYVEQIGTEVVKKMFKVDVAEIKRDVVDNIKSLDGAQLFLRIEDAMSSGNWDDAQDLWGYIKSRRIKIQDGLSADQQLILDEFISLKKDEGVFILSKGDLESYLPIGFRSKDMGKLIKFLEDKKFFEKLDVEAAKELFSISKTIVAI